MAGATSWHSSREPKNCFHEKGNLIGGGFFVLVLNAALVLISVAHFPGENGGCVLHICVISR